jgi:hypothetical protein
VIARKLTLAAVVGTLALAALRECGPENDNGDGGGGVSNS